MKINVPESAIDHFWQPTPAGVFREFWAFTWKPKCEEGDDIAFYYTGVMIARAVVDRIERPGVSECGTSGRYKNKWKVLWLDSTFRDVRLTRMQRLWLNQFFNGAIIHGESLRIAQEIKEVRPDLFELQSDGGARRHQDNAAVVRLHPAGRAYIKKVSTNADRNILR